MKSFLKWAGGKQRLIPELLSHVPESYNVYFEPFLGAGSLYFALRPKKAVIGDLNLELLETYKGVQNNPQEVIDLLKTYPNTKEDFCKIRDSSPTSQTERAARMVYINKCGFNGLYRVNKNGKCNVAWGKRVKVGYEFENILEVGTFLQSQTNTQILGGDYKNILSLVGPEDFIYLDPPYYGTFAGYTSVMFTNEDLQKLADFVDACVAKGAKVLISNSNHEEVKKAFAKYTIKEIALPWVISGKSKGIKKHTTEVLIKTW
jgi:DNA adenine methylase Dam